jgi:hypothetical protein
VRKDKGKRILTALSLPVIAALVYIYEKQGGSGMKCLFHSYTGLYCPGCGSGRAVHALFEGRIVEAVRYNILLPILGTPSLCILFHEYVRIVFPGLGLRPAAVSQKTAVAVTAVIIAFWILRNIPALAFLAPV